MEYLHTMLRIRNIDESLQFFCGALGMNEVRRYDNQGGRFTLIFLAASGDDETAHEKNSPLLELTYNWPDEEANETDYSVGRNFGHVAYRVDNLYEVCERLQQHGVTINRPPRDGYMAFVRSPDGISVELLQRGESLEPTEPWVSMKNSGEW